MASAAYVVVVCPLRRLQALLVTRIPGTSSGLPRVIASFTTGRLVRVVNAGFVASGRNVVGVAWLHIAIASAKLNTGQYIVPSVQPWGAITSVDPQHEPRNEFLVVS